MMITGSCGVGVTSASVNKFSSNEKKVNMSSLLSIENCYRILFRHRQHVQNPFEDEHYALLLSSSGEGSRTPGHLGHVNSKEPDSETDSGSQPAALALPAASVALIPEKVCSFVHLRQTSVRWPATSNPSSWSEAERHRPSSRQVCPCVKGQEHLEEWPCPGSPAVLTGNRNESSSVALSRKS